MGEVRTNENTPTWRLIGWSCHQTASSIFIVAMTFASYLASGYYGIAVVAAGLITTYTRLFDALIDPFLALITDRIQTRFGRVRVLTVVGRGIQILCLLTLFFWGIGKGAVFFTIIYSVYYIGSSLAAIATHTGNPVITTNPKKRPVIFRWMMIFTVFISTFTSFYMSNYLFAKHQGLNIGAFQELAVTVILIVLVLEIFAMIAISPYDRPEAFPKKKDGSGVNIKDMWSLLKGNRAMQMYILAGVSDKVASQATSQAAVTTLVYGVVIGNYAFNGTFSIYRLVPTILLLFFGTYLAGKNGTKRALVLWTTIAIALSAAMLLFLVVIDPTTVSVDLIPTAIFVAIAIAQMACGNVISACTNAMVPDIVDYELYRTGSFVPGTVGTLYSFIDEMVSSVSATIVAVCISFVGYTSAQPQPGDPCTTPVFWMTMFLWLGLPVLGWICTLVAMKWYPLDREMMEKVQAANREYREKQKKKMETSSTAGGADVQ